MNPFLIRRGLFVLALIFPALASAQPVEPQIFTDWSVVCDSDEACRMSQTVVQPSSSRVIVQARVFKGDNPTLLLTFPLGILLSTGWSYQIDGNRQTILPFEICNETGCHAGVKLEPNLLASLKRGARLTLRFRDAANENIEPVLSLSGFTKAYENLQ